MAGVHNDSGNNRLTWYEGMQVVVLTPDVGRIRRVTSATSLSVINQPPDKIIYRLHIYGMHGAEE